MLDAQRLTVANHPTSSYLWTRHRSLYAKTRNLVDSIPVCPCYTGGPLPTLGITMTETMEMRRHCPEGVMKMA